MTNTEEYTRLDAAIAALKRERGDIAIQITKEAQQRRADAIEELSAGENSVDISQPD